MSLRAAYDSARIKSWLSRMMKDEEYRLLAERRDTLDAWKLLKENSLPAMVELPESPRDVFTLERVLFSSYENHLTELAARAPHHVRRVLECFMEEWDMRDLKIVIRRVLSAHSQAPAPPETSYPSPFLRLGRSGKLPASLARARTLDEVQESLEGTIYSVPFATAREKYEETSDPFVFEVALDLEYYHHLSECCRRYSADGGLTSRLLRRTFDVKNLIWLLRYRFHYGLAAEQVFQFLLPFTYELGDEILLECARRSKPGEVLPVLAGTSIGDFLLQRLKKDESSVVPFEAACCRFLEETIRIYTYPTFLNTALFAAYFLLKEIERRHLQRLLTALESGKRGAEALEAAWIVT